nr:ATP-binding protein [Galbitalea soli]
MAVLMAVTLLVLLVQDIPLSTYLRQSEQDRITTSLERDAFLLAGRGEQALESGTTGDYAAITTMARTYQKSGGARVIITDADGTAIFSGDADDTVVGSSYKSRPEIATALTGQIATGTRYSHTLAQSLLYVAVPVLSGTNVYGAVRLTYPESVVANAVNSQLQLLVVAALTSVLLAGIVGYLLSTTITQSLGRLRSVTERIADGSLGDRADTAKGAGELRSLARSFNSMTDRLHTLIDQQRAFAADASHQLRTPLTALRLRLERAEELASVDPAGSAERLAAAQTEVDRLSDIIEGLLRLSRAEAADIPTEVVDVAAVARERVEEWSALAQDSGVRMSYRGPDRAPALAVPTAAQQIIDNYIDNALSVSPEGSLLEVVVTEEGRTVTVAVRDEGPGMRDEELARAFDRFWRAAGQQGDGGSGLGLAIVAQLAAASGGSVALARRESGGTEARVTLPAARATTPRGATGRRDKSDRGEKS